MPAPDPTERELTANQAAFILDVPISEIETVRRSGRTTKKPDRFIIPTGHSNRQGLEESIAPDEPAAEKQRSSQGASSPVTPRKRGASTTKLPTPSTTPKSSRARGSGAANTQAKKTPPSDRPAKKLRLLAPKTPQSQIGLPPTPEISAEKAAVATATQKQKRDSVEESPIKEHKTSDGSKVIGTVESSDLANTDPVAARIQAVKQAQAEGIVNPTFAAEEVLIDGSGFYVREKCYE
jgi:hypothetical protein